MTETEIIIALKSRSQKAFAELIDSHKDNVFRVCMGFVHNKEDAEDLVQEVFIEVFRSIEQFRSDSKISTWLYRISVNKSLNVIRKRKVRGVVKSLESILSSDKNVTFDLPDKNSTNGQKKMEDNERSLYLQKAINSLPERQKTAFVLNKYDELSYKEITEVMNLSLSSVESLLHRAKINLQKKLISIYNY